MSRRGGGMGRVSGGEKPVDAQPRPCHRPTAEGMYVPGKAHGPNVRSIVSNGQHFHRYEYAFKGELEHVAAFARAQVAAGAYLAEMRNVNGLVYALLMTRAPVELGEHVHLLTTEELEELR